MIHLKNKKILALTKKELNHTKMRQNVTFSEKKVKIKMFEKIKIITIILVNTEAICDLKFNVPNEIPLVFHTGSNYDYHFIIKESTKSFEG